MGMTPLINVLLAHLLASNDRLNVHKIISLIVSLIGLLLIVGMGSNGAPLDGKGSRELYFCCSVSSFRDIPQFRYRKIKAR